MFKKGGFRLPVQKVMEAWLFFRSIEAEACPRCNGLTIAVSRDGRHAVYCDDCERSGIICGKCRMLVHFVLDDKTVVIDTRCGCNG